MNFVLCSLLTFLFSAVKDSAFALKEDGNLTCEYTLPVDEMTKHCSGEILLHAPIRLIAKKHAFYVIDNCLNCSVTFRTDPDQQVVATVYTLHTESGLDGKCDLNRLDIYDGPVVDPQSLLSGDHGICGCSVSSGGEYKSSNNTMTIRLWTKCQTSSQHGRFELVLASVKNDRFNETECQGQYECQNGQCIDKNLVCNGENDCRDNSDEVNCHLRNGTCPGKFECENGECVDKNLVCNNVFDCSDGSDESNCTRKTNGTCPGMFECRNGKCIDKNKVCNGDDNCGRGDKSDEIGCTDRKAHALLYILIGVAGFCFILFVVILIIVCWKYCCSKWRMAPVYRRFD